MRATNHKSAGWVEVEDGFLIKILLGNDWLDDMLLKVSSNFIIGDSLIVLGGDENGVNTNWNHGTLVIVVLHSDLGLAIRPQPWASAILTNLSEAGTKLGGKNMAEGHKLRGLIGGIAKHVTLVTGTNVLRTLGKVAMDTLSNVGALLLDVDKDLAFVSIKTDVIRGEANGAACVTNNLLIIDIGFGSNLTKDHNHVGLGACFTGNLAFRVLG
uniref:Uncharacterized protein n=1 Tax=Opuntia streptacantha TaxID=393608 RepID=A0A7C9CRS8_OPUST